MVEPAVSGLGYELVDVQASNGGRLLRLFIDKPGGINVDDCAAVSRHLTRVLAVEGIDYERLEVSSPGLDRPLFSKAQYARFVGQSAKVGLKLPQDGRRRLQGRIDRVEADTVVFNVDGQPLEVAFDNIDKAKLIPDWEALGFAPKKPGHPKKQAKKH